ncbi:MAG: APC family permease [Gammaproteobacteria bacterium]|nr:APC family permease [Gammaproteobacteria bacterium]
MSENSNSKISLLAAISIGIGGMIGAGIFSILGVVAEAAGSAMWLSFLLGGIIALFSTYSYAKLGARFPTAGGAVEFLVQGWGKGTMSGGINLFMWIGYIISIALYAQGFSAYCLTFFTTTPAPLLSKYIAAGIVLFFTVINMLGAGSVGKAEVFIVVVKVSILVLFAAVGLCFIHPENLAASNWNGVEQIFFGAGVLFIGYEGFGLIANTAADMDNPQKNLPKALYLSVLIVIVIYLAVSITVIGNLPIHKIYASGDFALAEAAKPFLGELGFKLIAIAALFSTASAINATLFGAANVCYMIARDGELPKEFARTTWHGATEGLMITTCLVIVFILFFDLAGVTMMGSGAFLLIYAAVNAGHLKILSQTGANKSLVITSLVLCLTLFCILEIYTFKHSPTAVYTMIALLVGSFIVEGIKCNIVKAGSDSQG